MYVNLAANQTDRFPHTFFGQGGNEGGKEGAKKKGKGAAGDSAGRVEVRPLNKIPCTIFSGIGKFSPLDSAAAP